MFSTISIPSFHITNISRAELYSFGLAMKDAFDATTQKIKNIVTSPISKQIIDCYLGFLMYKVYAPLTDKILKVLCASSISYDPFGNLNLGAKIVLMPFVVILSPILEEKMFRGSLQEMLKNKLGSFYANLGFSDSVINITARITSVFFTSLIFGAVHFTNAITFGCNPVLFLPQVVATTIMGLMFGFAKEFSGDLYPFHFKNEI